MASLHLVTRKCLEAMSSSELVCANVPLGSPKERSGNSQCPVQLISTRMGEMDDYHNFFAAEAIAKLCREGRCDLQLSRYVVYDSFISIFWCTFGVTRLIFRPTVIKAETDERLLRCWCCQRYTTVKDFPPIKTPHYVWKVLHETLGL